MTRLTNLPRVGFSLASFMPKALSKLSRSVPKAITFVGLVSILLASISFAGVFGQQVKIGRTAIPAQLVAHGSKLQDLRFLKMVTNQSLKLVTSSLIFGIPLQQPSPSWITSALQQGCQRRCLDPHPGEFRWWNGQQNGCWIQVWRSWPDGCQHYQWFNSCNGYWDSYPNGAPRVYWTCCVH